jgi:HSP20 family protein
MQPKTITAIASVLIIVLGGQAYMLFRLNNRLEQLTLQTKTLESSEENIPRTPQALTPKSIPDDDFLGGRAWNPYEEMQHMQDEMDKIFGESFSRFHLNTPLGSLSKAPDVDLQDKTDHYLVTVNAPGADESSISVTLDDKVLRISIKTEQGKEENGNKNDDYRYRERFVGEFQRVLTLPGPADSAKMKTEYRNGVLTITIPKKQ